MTDVATVETEQTTAQDAGANGKVSKRNTAPVQITVPLDLKAEIEKRAEAENKTAARWVLENIAGDLGFALSEPQARAGARPTSLFPRTLTPEAKKVRFDAARTLLMALDSGKLDLNAIKSQLGI